MKLSPADLKNENNYLQGLIRKETLRANSERRRGEVRDAAIAALLALLESTDAPHGLLESAYRATDFCTECFAPHFRCGPELWEQKKKCCPECSHKAEPKGQP